MSGRIRPLRLSRFAATLVVFLILGACGGAATVAVAWFDAVRVLDHVSAENTAFRTRGGGGEGEDGLMWRFDVAHRTPLGTWLHARVGNAAFYRAAPHIPIDAGPAWSAVQRDPPSVDDQHFIEAAHGWPARALLCRLAMRDPRAAQWIVTTGLRVRPAPAAGDTPITLPTRPLWPGFAVNTAFYGGAFAFVWFAPGVVRRRVRRRRGQCQACGYPRPPHDTSSETSKCSECGAEIICANRRLHDPLDPATLQSPADRTAD